MLNSQRIFTQVLDKHLILQFVITLTHLQNHILIWFQLLWICLCWRRVFSIFRVQNLSFGTKLVRMAYLRFDRLGYCFVKDWQRRHFFSDWMNLVDLLILQLFYLFRLIAVSQPVVKVIPELLKDVHIAVWATWHSSFHSYSTTSRLGGLAGAVSNALEILALWAYLSTGRHALDILTPWIAHLRKILLMSRWWQIRLNQFLHGCLCVLSLFNLIVLKSLPRKFLTRFIIHLTLLPLDQVLSIQEWILVSSSFPFVYFYKFKFRFTETFFIFFGGYFNFWNCLVNINTAIFPEFI